MKHLQAYCRHEGCALEGLQLWLCIVEDTSGFVVLRRMALLTGCRQIAHPVRMISLPELKMMNMKFCFLLKAPATEQGTWEESPGAYIFLDNVAASLVSRTGQLRLINLALCKRVG